MLAMMILVILIISQFLFGLSLIPLYRRWKARNQEETKSGFLIVDGENCGRIIAILRYKRFTYPASVVIYFLFQIFTYFLGVPNFWNYLDAGPFVPRYDIFYGGIFCLLILGFVPFVYIIGTFWFSTVITEKGIGNRMSWPFNKRFFAKWDEIISVRFIILYAFRVRTKKGNFIMSSATVGLEYFANAIMDNVPRKKWTGYGLSPYRADDKLFKALDGPLR